MAIHALQSRPNLFQAHFAFGPSLWWDKKKVLNDTISFFENRNSFDNFLYMILGAEAPIVRIPFEQLSNYLNNNPTNKFNFKADIIESETHETSAIVGQFYAYRNLYSGWNVSPSMRNSPPNKAFNIIKKHYADLSTRFRYEIKPHEGLINKTGYFYLRNKKDVKVAIQFFRYNVETYPDSVNVYDSLADAYNANNQVTKSIEQMELLFKIIDKKHKRYDYYKGRQEKLIDAVK
jgi:hypothetical protein